MKIYLCLLIKFKKKTRSRVIVFYICQLLIINLSKLNKTFFATLLLLVFSCSPDEETPAPTNTVQTTTPEQPATTQYTLEVTAGEGGTVSTEGGTFNEVTEATVTATPAEGYEFIGWEGNDSTNESLTITLSSNQTILAQFEINSSSTENISTECNLFVSSDVNQSIKDLNRLCFVSSDPELYLNEESVVFNYTTISMTRTPGELWEYTSRKETFSVGNRNRSIIFGLQ